MAKFIWKLSVHAQNCQKVGDMHSCAKPRKVVVDLNSPTYYAACSIPAFMSGVVNFTKLSSGGGSTHCADESRSSDWFGMQPRRLLTGSRMWCSSLISFALGQWGLLQWQTCKKHKITINNNEVNSASSAGRLCQISGSPRYANQRCWQRSGSGRKWASHESGTSCGCFVWASDGHIACAGLHYSSNLKVLWLMFW